MASRMIPTPPAHWRRPPISIDLGDLPPTPFSVHALSELNDLLHSGQGIMRLAYIGDTLLETEVRLFAQKRFPDATAMGLSRLCSALTRNDTLSYLAHGYRLNEAIPSYVADPDQKRYADLFEAMIATFHYENKDSVRRWLTELLSERVFLDLLLFMEQGAMEPDQIGIFLGDLPNAYLHGRHMDSGLHSQFPKEIIVHQSNNLKYRMMAYLLPEVEDSEDGDDHYESNSSSSLSYSASDADSMDTIQEIDDSVTSFSICNSSSSSDSDSWSYSSKL